MVHPLSIPADRFDGFMPRPSLPWRGVRIADRNPPATDPPLSTRTKKNLGLNEISEVLGHTFLKFIFFSKALLGVESVLETQLRHLLHLGLYLDKNADFVKVI